MHAPRFDVWALARSGPALRLALWLGCTGVLSVILTLIPRAFGLDSNVLGPDSDPSRFGFIAFFCALLVMSRSNQGVAPFGLAISESWHRHFGKGFALGAVIVVLVALAATVGDARVVQFEPLVTWLSSFGKSLGGLPLAVAATLTFAGFVAGAAHERWGRMAAILLASGLYAALSLLHADMPPDHGDRADFIARFLIMGAVVQWRFRTGDIVLGAAFYAGLMFIERFVRKVDIFGDEGAHTWATTWFAPHQDLLRAPATWILLLALNIVLLTNRRKHPAEQSKPRTVSPRFAKAYPFASMGLLAPLDVWIPQLARARFRIDPIYLPRVIATLILSTINTLLTAPERLWSRWRPVRTPPAPVFIVGAHRSGTTHLHNLLSLDSRFLTPTTWQVMNPHGFRVSGWLLRPVFEIFAPWKRPMDAVAFGMSAPAEEEFAIANMSGLSPDWSLRLPRLAKEYDRFGFPDQMTDSERQRWGRLHRRFVSRIAGRDRRRPLLKNPHNTGRAAMLLDLYPDAQFVHIRRHPEDVLRSNAHLARTAHELFQVQDPIEGARYEDRYLSLYRAMEERFYSATDSLPPARVIDIRYEDLAADPVGTLRRVFHQLEWPWTEEYEARLRAYLARISDYTRNPKTPLTDEERAAIRRALGPVYERWRATDDEQPVPGSAASTTSA